MEFTAIYSTESIKNINYSFTAISIEKAIEYCNYKFSVTIDKLMCDGVDCLATIK